MASTTGIVPEKEMEAEPKKHGQVGVVHAGAPTPATGVTEKLFIAIAGLIGAGKTTLATALANEMNLPVYYEPVETNEYLEDFYKDQKTYGFPMQVYLLNKRFAQHQQIIWQQQGGVQDRSIYEDSVFATMLKDSGMMDERDYETYCSLFGHMSAYMKRPHFLVYLDVTPEESFKRIKMRSRDFESGIPLAYLRNLHRAYEVFIQDISRLIPVIRVNWSEFQTAETMAKVIHEEYKSLQIISHVTFRAGEPVSSSPPPTSPSK